MGEGLVGVRIERYWERIWRFVMAGVGILEVRRRVGYRVLSLKLEGFL